MRWQKKTRTSIQLLAKANIQLATIHRSKGEHELAVPLLVEVVRVSSPASAEGQKAYLSLHPNLIALFNDNNA